MEGLFEQYRRLIGHVVKQCSRFTVIDPEDMFQDACILMLKFFKRCPIHLDDYHHNKFKKSLFLWSRRYVVKEFKRARPTGHSLVRLTYTADDEGHENSVNLDDILAAEDTSLLVKIYAREFVAEMRRLLTGVDREIFNQIVEASEGDGTRGDWTRKLAARMGVVPQTIYAKVQKIRDTALRTLKRSA